MLGLGFRGFGVEGLRVEGLVVLWVGGSVVEDVGV